MLIRHVKNIKYIFVVLLSIATHSVKAQSPDSISVVFRAIGEGERFRCYSGGKIVLDVKLSGIFVDTLFKVPAESYTKGEPFYELVIARRGRFGLAFHDTGIQIRFDDKRYLVVEKNPYLRPKIAVIHYWTNERPKSERIRDILNPAICTD